MTLPNWFDTKGTYVEEGWQGWVKTDTSLTNDIRKAIIDNLYDMVDNKIINTDIMVHINCSVYESISTKVYYGGTDTRQKIIVNIVFGGETVRYPHQKNKVDFVVLPNFTDREEFISRVKEKCCEHILEILEKHSLTENVVSAGGKND